MVNCPKCCRHIEEKTTVCECGAILFGEVTNIAPWETETVFRSATVAAKRNILPVIGIVALIALGTLLAALPRLSVSVDGNETTTTDTLATSQSPDQTRSDLIPSDDLIDQSSASPFAVLANARAARPQGPAKTVRSANSPVPGNEIGAAAANPLDTQLLAADKDVASRKTADPANCEPETTSTLKKPEPAVAEVKKTAEPAASPYILGPRGGCFLVTASGGKKYVDRALCAPTAAAARQ